MTQGNRPMAGQWALILGASSGFGAAAAREFARHGINIFGVHMDRRSGMADVEKLIADIRAEGADALFFNINAADAEKRAAAVKDMANHLQAAGGVSTIKIVMHSLAFGTLKPLVGDNPKDFMTQAQIAMTMDVMAHSLIYWVQELLSHHLMGEGGRIFGMTSSGGVRVIPNYGAVSAAKSALESHIRQLAAELAKKGITANSIRAGVTDTPALRKIPGSDVLLKGAADRNPAGRLTTPEDVAQAMIALSGPGSHWITGNVIGVDGGEDIVV